MRCRAPIRSDSRRFVHRRLLRPFCKSTRPLAASSAPQVSAADRAQALAIFKQLVEINTTDTPQGNVTTATTEMQRLFLDAGFSPRTFICSGPMIANRISWSVPRCRNAAEKPVLFLCHMDVVQALRADWSTDPFQFIEKAAMSTGVAHRT